MNSRDNSRQSEKQRELVNRLEQIRQQRNASERTNSSETTRRNAGQQQPKPAQQTRRNTNQQKRSTSRRQVDTGQFSQPSYHQAPSREERESVRSAASMADISKVSEITDIGQMSSSKRMTSKTANSIINKLSNGNSIAESIIINEVLSKPIALKNRYR